MNNVQSLVIGELTIKEESTHRNISQSGLGFAVGKKAPESAVQTSNIATPEHKYDDKKLNS